MSADSLSPAAEASVFRQTEVLFRALVENAFDVILMLDADAQVLYASPAVRNYGRDPDDIVGRPVWDEFHPEDLPVARQRFQAALGQPSAVFAFEVRVRDGAGHWRYKQAIVQNLLEHPAIRAVIANVQDITERKEAEERLQQQEAALAHVSRVSVMGEMAAALAHEIGQPLHAIATFAVASRKALEADRPDSRGKAQQWAGQIEEQVQRATEIIRRLRQFTGRAAAEHQALDLNAVILEAVSLVAADLRRRRVRIALDLAPGLPPILADPIQIEQVLVNLLRNAAESMEGLPEAERRIQLRSWPEPQRLVASVCDAGPGISDDGLPHLFEAFYTTKPLGMGIGLAISRRIVEEHGGQLWATRNAARGMTFAFALPLPE
jgi:PAS domain S-box-containing protein